MRILLFTFFLCAMHCAFCQDSLQEVKKIPLDTTHAKTDTAKHVSQPLWSHNPQSPLKAALFSAVVPGLGQAYNKKYWKIPIVYAGLGVAGYFVIDNARFYQLLKTDYLYKTDDDSTTVATYDFLTADQLLQYANQWKGYTDLAVVITAAVYLLNIIDAIVDAHLYHFDVSDDLSMHIDPYFLPKNTFTSGYSAGISLKFSFR